MTETKTRRASAKLTAERKARALLFGDPAWGDHVLNGKRRPTRPTFFDSKYHLRKRAR